MRIARIDEQEAARGGRGNRRDLNIGGQLIEQRRFGFEEAAEQRTLPANLARIGIFGIIEEQRFECLARRPGEQRSVEAARPIAGRKAQIDILPRRRLPAQRSGRTWARAIPRR